MKSVEDIQRQVRDIRLRNYARDMRMGNVRAVRSGDVSHIVPGLFPDIWPKPVVANVVDVAAAYTAEQIGVMPTVSCTAGVMVSDRQKKYAMKRTLIAHKYIEDSKMKVNLVSACDWFNTYGFLPVIVEPHFGDAYCEPGPRLRFESPLGSYYDLDAYGRCRSFIKVYEQDVSVLAAKFPHLASRLVDDPSELLQSVKIEMVQYYDDEQLVTYLPQKQNLVISQVTNKLGRCPVWIAERPKYDDQVRGAFDDVIWVHLARAYLAMMNLESVHETVNAPIIAPMDMQKFSWGKGAIIKSNNPQQAHKMEIPINPAAFQSAELLNSEVMVGSRFPEGATGKSPGSVVTGRGMEELMGTIDTKSRTYQLLVGDIVRQAIGACFEMDQKFWPRSNRQVRVMVNGQMFEETYTPIKDIAGIYQVDVTYGMAAGMDPSRAMVFLLQARGDKLISRDFALRQLPFDINADQIQEQIDVEEMHDALKQGIFQYVGALGMLVQQGQDGSAIIHQLATLIKQREAGKPLHDAAAAAFTPKTPPPGSSPPGGPPGAPASPDGGPGGAPGPGQQAPGGGAPPGMGGPQAAPGQAQMGPGGTPDIQKLLAGLSGGGQANLQDNVARRIPAG